MIDNYTLTKDTTNDWFYQYYYNIIISKDYDSFYVPDEDDYSFEYDEYYDNIDDEYWDDLLFE